MDKFYFVVENNNVHSKIERPINKTDLNSLRTAHASAHTKFKSFSSGYGFNETWIMNIQNSKKYQITESQTLKFSIEENLEENRKKFWFNRDFWKLFREVVFDLKK